MEVAAEPDVVQDAADAQGDVAVADAVVSDAVSGSGGCRRGRLWVARGRRRRGFCRRVSGVGGGGCSRRRTGRAVFAARRSWLAVGWAVSQRLRVWWKRSTLPQVVGWFGRLFFWMTPRLSRRVSKPLRPPLPPDSRVVNTIPLSVSVEAGTPCASRALVNVSTTMGPVTRRWAVTEIGVAGVVVDPAQDLDVGAVGEAPVGEVGLPASHWADRLGSGCRTSAAASSARPWSGRRGAGSRCTVGRDTVSWWSLARCQTIVSAPASRPVQRRAGRGSRRSARPSPSGCVVGSSAVAASAARTPRHPRRGSGRASLETQPFDTWYSRATSTGRRPSTTTAVMTRRAIDTHQRQTAASPSTADGVSDHARHRFPMS